MTIHGLSHALANRGLDHICAQVEHRDQLGSLQAVEITQNMVLRSPSSRPPDAHSAAREVRAPAVLYHRAKSVVAGRPAAHLEPHDPEIEVELVVNAHNLPERDLEEAHGGLNGLPAQVHEGHGFEKHHVVVADSDLGELTLELVSETGRTPAPHQLVDHHESNIVAISGVLRTRVSEASDEMRAHGPPGA